jgi:hypothetical protein
MLARVESPMMQKNDAPTSATIEIIGTVERIIPASETGPELAQIFISCADGTFAEIRVQNSLQDKYGHFAGFRKGAHVEITIKPDRRTKATHA